MSHNRVVLRRLGTLLKEASYTKKVLETLGKAATDTLVNKLMSDENFDLKEFFETQKKIHESIQVNPNSAGIPNAVLMPAPSRSPRLIGKKIIF